MAALVGEAAGLTAHVCVPDCPLDCRRYDDPVVQPSTTCSDDAHSSRSAFSLENPLADSFSSLVSAEGVSSPPLESSVSGSVLTTFASPRPSSPVPSFDWVRDKVRRSGIRSARDFFVLSRDVPSLSAYWEEFLHAASVNTDLFMDGVADVGDPWVYLAPLYGLPRLRRAGLLSEPALLSFPLRDLLLEYSSPDCLARGGLFLDGKFVRGKNLRTVSLDPAFIVRDFLSDCLHRFKFPMVWSVVRDQVRLLGGKVTGVGPVPKCKCEDWPTCGCKSRKIVNASNIGGLNESYPDRSVWPSISPSSVSSLCCAVVQMVARHPGEQVLIGLFDGDAAYKQIVRHPSEWLGLLNVLGPFCFVGPSCDFGDAFSGFAWDVVPQAIAHVFRAKSNCDSSYVDHHVDDLALVSIGGTFGSASTLLLSIGSDTFGIKWSEKKKCDWVGMTARKVWGVRVDTVRLSLSLPADKWAKARAAALSFAVGLSSSLGPVVSGKDCQRYAGYFNWVSVVLPWVAPMFRTLYKLGSAERMGDDGMVALGPFPEFVRVSSDAVFLLLLFAQPFLNEHPMDPLVSHSADVVIVSDASGGGFCVRVDFVAGGESVFFCDSWSDGDVAALTCIAGVFGGHSPPGFDINIRELVPIIMAFFVLGPLLLGSHVFVYSDNSTVVRWLTSLRARSPSAQLVLRLLTVFCVNFRTSVTAAHFPGDVNVFADIGSRLCPFDEGSSDVLSSFMQMVVNRRTSLLWLPPVVRCLGGLLSGSSSGWTLRNPLLTSILGPGSCGFLSWENVVSDPCYLTLLHLESLSAMPPSSSSSPGGCTNAAATLPRPSSVSSTVSGGATSTPPSMIPLITPLSTDSRLGYGPVMSSPVSTSPSPLPLLACCGRCCSCGVPAGCVMSHWCALLRLLSFSCSELLSMCRDESLFTADLLSRLEVTFASWVSMGVQSPLTPFSSWLDVEEMEPGSFDVVLSWMVRGAVPLPSSVPSFLLYLLRKDILSSLSLDLLVALVSLGAQLGSCWLSSRCSPGQLPTLSSSPSPVDCPTTQSALPRSLLQPRADLTLLRLARTVGGAVVLPLWLPPGVLLM